jgi:hypothetical protein
VKEIKEGAPDGMEHVEEIFMWKVKDIRELDKLLQRYFPRST